MQVDYKNKKIEKICTDFSAAEKNHGTRMATKIHQRIDQIKAIESVEEMIQYKIGRCHSLNGQRKGQYAVDLLHPFRLVFEVKQNVIQIAKIIEIVDYHK